MSLLLAQGGRIGIIGVYVGYTNHFNIGGFMEKSMAAAGGQVRHTETNSAAVDSKSIITQCCTILLPTESPGCRTPAAQLKACCC